MSDFFSEALVECSRGFMVHRCLPVAVTPKAMVLIVHGMGEHPGRYSDWVASFASNGIGSLRYAQQGHSGRLESKGHCHGIDSLMDDLAAVQSEFGLGVPLFLLGHSMGGAVVTNYILKRKPQGIAGVVLSSPYFELAFEPPAWKTGMANLFAGMWPSLTQPTGLNVNHISRIALEVEKYKRDPSIHGKMSAAFFQAIHPAGKWALGQAEDWTIPVLIGHGLADKITSAEASKRFFDALNGNTLKKGFWPEQGFHELHHEPERAEWMQAQLDFFDGVLRGN